MKLFPYQVEGARYLASNKRAGLFDEPGLGKSCQSLTALKLIEAKRALIICPAYLLSNWQHELSKTPVSKCHFRFLSYHYIRICTQIKEKFDVCIVDESHCFKNPASKQSQNFLNVFLKGSKRLWLLTGTPATKTAADYFLQLSMLKPGEIGTYKDFYERYAYVRTIGTGLYKRKDVYGFRNAKELNPIIRSCSLRRTVEEVLPELPKKFFQDLYINIPPPEVDEDLFEESLRRGKMDEALIPPFQQFGLDKVKEAEEFLQSIQKPFIVFCWFRRTAKAVANALAKEHGPECISLLTGEDAPEERARKIRRFQEGEKDILVCTYSSAGVGTNMQRAQTVVNVELPFSPAIYDQGWARAVRIGQTKKVRIVNIIAEDSPDDRILEILQDKREGMEECLR